MPFGLKDTAFSLLYVMDNILNEFDKAKSFFDDCILYGKRADHLDLLNPTRVGLFFTIYGLGGGGRFNPPY